MGCNARKTKFKELTKAEKIWNNPDSLEELNGIIWRVAMNIASQELNGIIWRVAISIASQELYCMSRNIFGVCEACVKVGC
jgi:cobalamin biosynthesis Mg chelatase CobN